MTPDPWCECGYRRSAHTEKGDVVMCPVQEYKTVTGEVRQPNEKHRYWRQSPPGGFNETSVDRPTVDA